MKNKINIKIKEITEKTFYLNQSLGSGSLGDIQFDVTLRLPDYSFVVQIADKEYLVEAQDIIFAVVDYHKLINIKK
jgi:hypothetical protein